MKRAIIIAAAAILLASTIWSGAQMFAQLFGATGTPIPALAWYKLDGNALDSSGNGRNGTWSGTEAYAAGKFAGTQAGSFDGTNFVGILALSNESNLTVSAWVRLNSGLPSSFRGVVCGQTSGPNFGLQGETAVRLVDPPMSSLQIAGSNFAQTWTHIAYTYENGSVTKIYRAGEYIGSGTGAGGVSRAMRIGRTSLQSQSFVGLISDVRIYNRALSPANIARIMESQNNEPLEELQ